MTWTMMALSWALLGTAHGETTSDEKHILVYTKAASWEHENMHRDHTNDLSYLEKVLQKLGDQNHIAFTFTKDGTVFTPENIAKYDAFFFYTSGDLTHEDRESLGRGDNFPLMTLEGKKAFLDAIDNGKGFVGVNEANYTFTDRFSPGEERNPTNAFRYTQMIGAGFIGHNDVQKGCFTYLDRKFPGMENLPADYAPIDQWYAFNRLMPDIHVLIAVDSPKLKGNLYERAPYPVVWARMQGKGRVYYTTMGHEPAIWEEPGFQQMLLGGIRWASHALDADVTRT